MQCSRSLLSRQTVSIKTPTFCVTKIQLQRVIRYSCKIRLTRMSKVSLIFYRLNNFPAKWNVSVTRHHHHHHHRDHCHDISRTHDSYTHDRYRTIQLPTYLLAHLCVPRGQCDQIGRFIGLRATF